MNQTCFKNGSHWAIWRHYILMVFNPINFTYNATDATTNRGRASTCSSATEQNMSITQSLQHDSSCLAVNIFVPSSLFSFSCNLSSPPSLTNLTQDDIRHSLTSQNDPEGIYWEQNIIYMTLGFSAWKPDGGDFHLTPLNLLFSGDALCLVNNFSFGFCGYLYWAYEFFISHSPDISSFSNICLPWTGEINIM